MTRIITLLTLLLLMSGSVSSQVNLVLNGDFEQHSYCPRGFDDTKACIYWAGIDSAEIKDCDRMDYCHTCATIPAHVNIPKGKYYYQFAHSGNAFFEVAFYFNSGSETSFWRHYLQGRLRKRLIAGKRYCVSFWVNLAEGSKYAVKELSAYLDNGSIDTTTMCGAPQTQYTPQITWSGNPITDTTNWIKVEGSFVANGTEQFITLGTYKDIIHSTVFVLPFNTPVTTSYAGLYLVDDVSVVPSDTKADAGPDRHIGYGDSVYIGRPSAEAIWCDWRVKGFSTVIGQGPSIWVKPTATTSYVMSQTLCDYTTTDTVKVYVGETSVASVGAADEQQYIIIPNPNDGNITLLQKLADSEPVNIKVYNSIGALVRSFNVSFENNASMLNLSNISMGVYYMVLINSIGESYHLTFVKK